MGEEKSTFQLILLMLFCLLIPASSIAKKKQNTPAPQAAKVQTLEHSGAIRGGQSEQYQSLLDIRRLSWPQKKKEQVIIDWGDRVFERTLTGGYYQVEYRESTLQLILSFSLTLNTKFENEILHKKVSDGIYIKDAQLDFDSMTQTMIITFKLRNKISLKVTEVNGSPQKLTTAQLILDLNGIK